MGVLLSNVDVPGFGKDAVEVSHAVVNYEPIPLSQARPRSGAAPLQQTMDRALKKNPRARYQRLRLFATICEQSCATSR